MVLEHEHDPERVPLYRFLGPRYWLLWLGLGLVRAVNTLPLRWQMAVGRGLGRVAHARQPARPPHCRYQCPPVPARSDRGGAQRPGQGPLRVARLRAAGNRPRLVGEPAAPAAIGRLRGCRAPARSPREGPRRTDAERALHDARDGRTRPHPARSDQHHVSHAEEPADRRDFAPQPRPAHSQRDLQRPGARPAAEPEEQPAGVVCAGPALHREEQRDRAVLRTTGRLECRHLPPREDLRRAGAAILSEAARRQPRLRRSRSTRRSTTFRPTIRWRTRAASTS